MSYTGEEIFNMAVAIKNELSDTGAVSDADVAEYRYRAPYLLDAWQHEIVKQGDLFKTFELSCMRKKNLLGDTSQGIAVENNGEEQSYNAKGVNCFYFEVDGDCTVTFPGVSGKYIFNNGTEIDFNETITITVPAGTTSFLPCKGIFNAKADVTMKFSGTYYFRHINRALCAYKYSSASKVPDFKPWYKVTMPADFKSKTQVINEYPNWQYQNDASHKWEGNNELYVSFSYEGIIRIKYIPIPAKITALSQTIEVDENTAISGAYYLAEQFCITEGETEIAAVCKRKYAELKAEASKKAPLSAEEIIDVYGM